MAVKALGSNYFLFGNPKINICRINRARGEAHENDLTEVLHYHDFTEIIMVIKGKGTHLVEGHESIVSAGDIFVLQGYQKHAFKDASQLEIVNVMFDEEQLSKVLDVESFKKIPGYNALFILEPQYRNRYSFKYKLGLNRKNMARLELLLSELFWEQTNREPGFETMMVNKLEELIIFLSRLYTKLTSREARSLVRIGRVIDFIEENYDSDITLELLAEKSFMSERNFQRVFKNAMGETPINYLIQIRLEKARRLLKETDLPVVEISNSTGFNDAAYFSRKFKNATGITPMKYRMQ